MPNAKSSKFITRQIQELVYDWTTVLNQSAFRTSKSLYIFLASNSEWKIYRKLYSFESAYVSLKRIIGSVEELSNQLRLVLIRNYWNPLVDEELLNVREG